LNKGILFSVPKSYSQTGAGGEHALAYKVGGRRKLLALSQSFFEILTPWGWNVKLGPMAA
jgi:hypothetical protein